MKHRLDPLLRPRSVAVVGASADPDSMGGWALENLRRGGYHGSIYPINPRYAELGGFDCYATLADTPETPDLVIFALSDQRIEAVFDEAVAAAVPAAVIMSSLCVDDDRTPPLKERIQQKACDAGMLVCGANGMGFYNIRDNVWACGFDSCLQLLAGNVSLISHSGSGMSGIMDCEERLRINVAVSCGNEISVSMDEYLDFVLDLPETKVVGLFVETARNPDGFRKALAKAASKQIPIVAIKVGRTELAAKLTVSHSGALAGDDATYDALFERYGVQRVTDMDELATTLIMFAEMYPLGDGGLVAMHDSGGERQLMVDLADKVGVPLTSLSTTSVAALEDILDAELPAINPLDAWSRGGPDSAQKMTRCLTIMMQDAGAAIAALVLDRAPDGLIYASYIDYMRHAQETSGKPVALVSARQGTGSDRRAVDWTHKGLPVLDGVSSFLVGVRCLIAYRDFQQAAPMRESLADEGIAAHWRTRLTRAGSLDEPESLQMLRDFGLPATPCIVVDKKQELQSAAQELGFPLVLKTAMPGIAHKSERQGVKLGLRNERELTAAYQSLSRDIGPRTMLAPMVGAGIEMFIGMRHDPQFGPLIVIGFGGVLAETIGDVIFSLPPFDADYVRRRLGELTLHPLLDGVRGEPAADVAAFCETAAGFSAMVVALQDVLEVVDVNPVIVADEGCVAVDSLVVGRGKHEQS